MIKEQISKDYMVALREKNTVIKNLLSVVKGEIQTIEKNIGSESLSDEEVIKILSKTAKSLRETMSFTEESNRGQINEELSFIESYLPKQMSREEVTKKVTDIVNSGITNIGGIMKEFATLSVDKKVVSEVIKEIVK